MPLYFLGRFIMKHIHWFPGHIAKAQKQLKEMLGLVDVVIEVIDARIPLSSGYPEIEKLLGKKPRLILLNKSDLADEKKLDYWKNRFEKSTGYPVLKTCAAKNTDISAIENKIAELGKEKIEALVRKGLQPRPVRVVVVGMPNVGKSSIINKLIKKAKTKVGAKAGVTKTQQWVRVNPKIDLLDTPGIIPVKQENQKTAIKLAMVNSVSENAYENEDAARELLKILEKKYKQNITDYYNLEENTEISLENIALKRNWLAKEGKPDVTKAAVMVLTDFRTGKTGRFTLDDEE